MKFLIPRTDLSVSPLCLGLADIGAGIEPGEAYRMIDRFLDRGCNFLDTARVYSDWVPGETGRSERIIGEYLKARGGRGIVLATKGGHPRLGRIHEPRLRPETLREDVELSLRALGVGAIDLYYVHRDDPSMPAGEILETLESFKRQGLVRHYACSNWRAERLREAWGYAEAHGLAGFVCNQMLWNAGSSAMLPPPDDTLARWDADMDRFHGETGMMAAPYSSQANGFFTYLSDGVPPENMQGSKSLYNTPGNLRVYDAIRKVRGLTGYSVTAIVLQYLLAAGRAGGFPVSPIVGCKSTRQLDDSLAALDCPLDGEAYRILSGAACEEP